MEERRETMESAVRMWVRCGETMLGGLSWMVKRWEMKVRRERRDGHCFGVDILGCYFCFCFFVLAKRVGKGGWRRKERVEVGHVM
jgi:hypothetical protein